jgi:hypothetical protein
MDQEDEGDPERADDLDPDTELRDRPMTLAPVMLSVVWIASRTSVMRRMVECHVGSHFVPNHLCARSVAYGTTPVSTEATVTSSAIP